MARIEQQRTGSVLTLVNNDPATRNSISADFYVGMREALTAADADRSIKAIVLTGAGGFFCSGGNMSGLKARVGGTREQTMSSVEKLHDMVRTMRASRLPIIAAVEGGAAGAGAALAMACDLVVAARDAYMSVAYVKIGLTPDGGSTVFFGRGVPRQFLQEMVWTGDRVPVERLHQLGMVNRLVEPGTAVSTSEAWAAEIARGPADAIARGKRLVEAASHASMEEQLEAEAEGIATSLGGAEAKEGISAFLEKRKPDFAAVG
ncbi:oxepin-CoA hydrolase, alternative type [Acuticoccus sp.]|uniref:oxepin-CoA hydrolase, alternative type n=1 Tax=Acuticoccus sp. TaxID=1904378 RepID=UPI003B518180